MKNSSVTGVNASPTITQINALEQRLADHSASPDDVLNWEQIKDTTMTTIPTFSIAVYCGSRTGLNPEFVAAAKRVGAWIGARRGRLVYGGGDVGLMGVVASSTLAAGGTVLGVIPQILMDKEVAKRDCTELIVVPTMHERKALMMQHADAFLALPGGIGTLEELFEVWTWAQLGYHNKPIGLLNTAQFYDGLWRFMQHTVAQGFLSESQLPTVAVDASEAQLLTQLVTQAGLAVTDDELAATL